MNSFRLFFFFSLPPQNSDDENSNSSHEINSSDHCDQDDFEVQLRKPKYLQCPAIFTISNLKKFLLHKFSINPNKFCVEIMYKVKPLLLPDHYTLMDVAYIFTWKRVSDSLFYCFYFLFAIEKFPLKTKIIFFFGFYRMHQ